MDDKDHKTGEGDHKTGERDYKTGEEDYQIWEWLSKTGERGTYYTFDCILCLTDYYLTDYTLLHLTVP